MKRRNLLAGFLSSIWFGPLFGKQLLAAPNNPDNLPVIVFESGQMTEASIQRAIKGYSPEQFTPDWHFRHQYAVPGYGNNVDKSIRIWIEGPIHGDFCRDGSSFFQLFSGEMNLASYPPLNGGLRAFYLIATDKTKRQLINHGSSNYFHV